MVIVGAGLSGLIAANLLPDAQIVERGEDKGASHKALLRFRTPDVGNAVGIEFKPVTVHKGIWSEGRFVEPTIQLANLYSRKVIGAMGDRSIWKVEPVTRYIAPEDLYSRLLARCYKRINWNCSLNDVLELRQEKKPIISTAPLGDTAKLVGFNVTEEFKHAGIHVRRFRVKNCNVYQTVYYPDPFISLYRASITGNLLIAEYMENAAHEYGYEGLLFDSFGIHDLPEGLPGGSQRYGKIAPINDVWRRECIHQLTLQHRIYSLGRFATWRNILLDDVLKDIYVIKRLLAGDTYLAALHGA